MKRPITTTTVIALALGTAAVVAPTATADNDYGLGGKDGSGVIARGDQMASDIGAGSCRVGFDKDEGSQSGVNWNTSEPGSTSPDKTRWGYTISFDNSHDRTFSDWSFRAHTDNQIKTKEFLRLDGLPTKIPAVEAGQKFINWDVTHTADELAWITKEGRSPLALSIPSELTDDKVSQFAQATADNPVRYAWQDHYVKENTDNTTQITRYPFTEFSVNPWPSENNELSLIHI